MPWSGTKNSGLESLLSRPRPTAWQKFLKQPYLFLARLLYAARPVIAAQPVSNPVSVVCISDTHNSQPSLPDGDVLIHAGDLTQAGTVTELRAALEWLRGQPHRTKIVVAGNHDNLLDASRDDASGKATAERASLEWGDVIYLENSEVTITCSNGRRLRVYGSPLSPRHGNWAFQYPRTKDVWTKRIPHGIDILITHGPPRGHLDLLTLGCPYLLQELWRVRPRLYVFGHVHEGAGSELLSFDELQKAYENTIVANGGFWNLVLTAIAFVWAIFRPTTEAKCQLVNPSMVGGLRDDERRQPIKVLL